jgi:hypothetical protein
MLFHYADTYVGFAHYVLFVNVRTQNLDAWFVLLAIPTLSIRLQDVSNSVGVDRQVQNFDM